MNALEVILWSIAGGLVIAACLVILLVARVRQWHRSADKLDAQILDYRSRLETKRAEEMRRHDARRGAGQ